VQKLAKSALGSMFDFKKSTLISMNKEKKDE